jgi:MFS family permease
MFATLAAFTPLYLTSLVLLTSTGMLAMYIGLFLTQQSVSETWIGALMAGYYLGVVLGGRLGHKFISQVGHIRAFAVCAAVGTCLVLGLDLSHWMPLWLGLRIAFGIVIVTALVVIESWFNEKATNQQRGRVFAAYMVACSLGTMLGQLALTGYTRLNEQPLIIAAMLCALCLVPLTMVNTGHPSTPRPAPLDLPYYFKRVPAALFVLVVSGLEQGSFYGLAAVYAVKQGFTPAQAAVFMSVAVGCALLSQWPMGWLSDRFGRARVVRWNALLLAALPVLLWGWFVPPFWLLVLMGCVQGPLQSSLYPLGVALANDSIDPERRVGVSAVLYMAYGVGACVGPLAAGALMAHTGPASYYVFVSACAVLLLLLAVRKADPSVGAGTPVEPAAGPAPASMPVPTPTAEFQS